MRRQEASDQPDLRQARESPGLVPALENAIAIIRYLNDTPPHMASLAELAKALSISRSHCHSILKTLAHFEWLRYDERSKAYQLHIGLIGSASSVLRSPVLDRMRPPLIALADKVKFPCVIAQPLADASYVLIEKFEGSQSMAVWYPIGHRFPVDAPALMRAYWAAQSASRSERWLKSWRPRRYTGETSVGKNALRDEITATRTRGYARSLSEYTDGLMVLAAPIFDSRSNIIFIVGCMGLMPAFAAHEQPVAIELKATVAQIHHAILGRPPAWFGSGDAGSDTSK